MEEPWKWKQTLSLNGQENPKNFWSPLKIFTWSVVLWYFVFCSSFWLDMLVFFVLVKFWVLGWKILYDFMKINLIKRKNDQYWNSHISVLVRSCKPTCLVGITERLGTQNFCFVSRSWKAEKTSYSIAFFVARYQQLLLSTCPQDC